MLFKPADGTIVQVFLYVCSNGETPVDGTLILHLDMTLQPRVRTATFINYNQKQYAYNNYNKNSFGAICYLPPVGSVPTQQANNAQALLTERIVSAVAACAQNHVKPQRSCLKLSSKCILAAHLPH